MAGKNSPSRLDAVVLAGRRNEGRLREVSGEPWEALIDLMGKPIVRYPVEALAKAKNIGRIVVVGPKPELAKALAGLEVDIVPPGEGMLENALLGCKRATELAGGKHGLVFIATGDLPLVTSDIIDGLIEMCLERGGDLFYPVIERSVMEAKFPGTRRTYGTLRDGTFTGGNLFVANSAILGREASKAEALIKARKNALKMAQALGFSFLVRLLFGRLTIAQVEEHIRRRFGFVGRTVIIPWAEVGVDVDKKVDIELVQAYLGARR